VPARDQGGPARPPRRGAGQGGGARAWPRGAAAPHLHAQPVVRERHHVFPGRGGDCAGGERPTRATRAVGTDGRGEGGGVAAHVC
jgi:hypothetical protein